MNAQIIILGVISFYLQEFGTFAKLDLIVLGELVFVPKNEILFPLLTSKCIHD